MNRTSLFSPVVPVHPYTTEQESPPQIAGTRRGRESDSSSNGAPPLQRQRIEAPRNHRPAIAQRLLHSWNRFRPPARPHDDRDAGQTAHALSGSSANAGASRDEGVPPRGQSEANPENNPQVLVSRLMRSWHRFSPGVRRGAAPATGTAPEALAEPSANSGATLHREAAPPHASQSLLRWAEESRRRIMELENAPVLLARDRYGNFANEPALRQFCFDIAYRLYARPATTAQRLDGLEQEQFLHDLEALAEGGTCTVIAQPMDGLPRGLSPVAALEHNRDLAITTHYYVKPDDMDARHASNTDGSESRISLTVTPSHVVEVANNMVPLLAEFADFITHFKVTSPRGQGTRPDSIVIYLNQARIARARELAARLRGIARPEAWAAGGPLGMQPLHAGIAYAEFNRHSVSHSFGEDRARMVVDALVNSMNRGTPLQIEVERSIRERRYSLDNPALIART